MLRLRPYNLPSQARFLGMLPNATPQAPLEAGAAAEARRRRLQAYLGPVDIGAVKCQVLPLLRIEVTNVALGS